jgi:hypothetical protein
MVHRRPGAGINLIGSLELNGDGFPGGWGNRETGTTDRISKSEQHRSWLLAAPPASPQPYLIHFVLTVGRWIRCIQRTKFVGCDCQ